MVIIIVMNKISRLSLFVVTDCHARSNNALIVTKNSKTIKKHANIKGEGTYIF